MLAVLDLVQLGKSRSEYAKQCAKIENSTRALYFSADEVRLIAQSLNFDDFIYLIKGIVLYGCHSRNGSGGSASSVSAFYMYVVENFPTEEPELCRWIVENWCNPYEPFGTTSHNHARNYREFCALQKKSDDKRKATAKIQAKVEEADQLAKKIRDSKKADMDMPNAIRRGDLLAVKALISKGAAPNRPVDEYETLLAFAEAVGKQDIAEYLRSLGQ